MGSSLRRLKIYYINNFKVTRHGLWVIVAAALLLMVTSRLLDYRPTAFYETSGDENSGTASMAHLLESMPDTRPMRCRDHAYEFTRLEVSDVRVSIVTQFSGSDDLEQLKLTLTSIVLHTPYDLYAELIVIDDGTDSVEVQKTLAVFLQDSRFNKVKVYRSSTRDGHSPSRFKGSAVATGNILIFVDTTAVVNHGWVQPLIAKLLDEQNLLAVPHYDDWANNDRLVRVDDDRASVFTWTMSTVYSSVASESDMFRTPVMRGDVFAVHKSFLDHIGGFDEHLRQQRRPGYHVELSFRAWSCGGSIKVVTCSRVAVRGAQRPLVVSDAADLRHIVELSLEENLRQLVYRQSGVDSTLSKKESDSLMVRRNFLSRQRAQVACRPFAWYMGNVAVSDVVRPSSDMKQFGKLKSVGLELCLGGGSENGIGLVACHQNLYERGLLVELTVRGAVMRDAHCLEPTDAAGSVAFGPCEDESPRQRWWMVDGRLTPVTSPRKCLAAMSTSRRATLRDCDDVDSTVGQRWKVINF